LLTFQDVIGVFDEKKLVLAYFCPVWHTLKHNLAYFIIVVLATLQLGRV